MIGQAEKHDLLKGACSGLWEFHAHPLVPWHLAAAQHAGTVAVASSLENRLSACSGLWECYAHPLVPWNFGGGPDAGTVAVASSLENRPSACLARRLSCGEPQFPGLVATRFDFRIRRMTNQMFKMVANLL